jgi:regulator of ribonuclease activity A
LDRPRFQTADLCDEHDELIVAEPLFTDFGGTRRFCGEVTTLACFEDNSLVREALGEPGRGRVLVVGGGGSRRCALLGDRLGALAVENGWSGLVIHGCVRDTEELARLDLGVRALAACPRKSVKRGEGRRDVTVRFAGVTLRPGTYLYADADGLVVAPRSLL